MRGQDAPGKTSDKPSDRTPDDSFHRDHDPSARRRATILAAVAAGVLAVLVGGISLARPSSGRPPVVAVGASPAPASPAPSSPRPTLVPAAPVVGSGSSAVDDPAIGQLVLFGGVDSYDLTWIWDGSRWALARPALSPPGRFRAAAAYDPSTGLVMVYGGRLAPGQAVNDTWAWDGWTWRELDRGTGDPPPGEDAVMAWDPAAGAMVMAGGAAAPRGRTWTWTGDHWTRAAGPDLPAGAFLVGLAFDPGSASLLGASCCAPGDGTITTWAWKGGGWRRLTTRAQPAFIATLALDPVSGRPLLLGDPVFAAGREMWSWTGNDWALLTGARLPLFPQAQVTGTDSTLLLGSAAQPVQGSPQPLRLWSWTGVTWRRVG